MFKKAISFVLCISMILSVSICAFATESEDDKTINYVSFGSSQTVGYGSGNNLPDQFGNWYGTEAEKVLWNNTPDEYKYLLSSWNPYDLKRYDRINYTFNTAGIDVLIENGFPCILKRLMENLGYSVNFSQLAYVGCYSDELLALLDDEYITDKTVDSLAGSSGYLSKIMDVSSIGTEAAYRLMCDKYRAAVQHADFITYDVGAADASYGICNMVGFWANSYTEHVNPDYELILDENDYKQFKVIRETLISQVDKILDLSNIDEADALPIRNLIDNTAYGMLSYCACLDKTMEIIYSCNPDVCVTVLQIQNFYEGQVYTLNGYDIPVGDILQIAIDILNTYASSFSKYCDKYYFARFTDDQRVEFNYDFIKAYNGDSSTISDTLKFIYDVNDKFFEVFIKSMYTEKYEQLLKNRKFIGLVGDKQYQTGLTASYDAFTQLFSYVINNYKAELSLMNEGSTDVMKPLVDNMLESVANICLTQRDGDYSVAIEDAKAAFDALDPADQSAVAMIFTNQYASTAIVHPTAKGQQQVAQGIVKTLMMDSTGMERILSGLKSSAVSFKKSFTNIGTSIGEIAESLVNESKDDMKSMISEIISSVPVNPVKTIVSEIKNNIGKTIVSPVNSLISKIKILTK